MCGIEGEELAGETGGSDPDDGIGVGIGAGPGAGGGGPPCTVVPAAASVDSGMARRARASSCALWKRRPGSFSSRRRMAPSSSALMSAEYQRGGSGAW